MDVPVIGCALAKKRVLDFFGCLVVLEGARASTGLSLLCVDVGYKQWSNDICA